MGKVIQIIVSVWTIICLLAQRVGLLARRAEVWLCGGIDVRSPRRPRKPTKPTLDPDIWSRDVLDAYRQHCREKSGQELGWSVKEVYKKVNGRWVRTWPKDD